MTLQEAVLTLMTVRKEVFGDQPGDEPDAHADYDRACELARMMNQAIDALVGHLFSSMSDAAPQSGDTQ